jgi:hypothetical protein
MGVSFWGVGYHLGHFKKNKNGSLSLEPLLKFSFGYFILSLLFYSSPVPIILAVFVVVELRSSFYFAY